MSDDFAGTWRRIGEKRFLARCHADDERVQFPAEEQRSHRAESGGLRDDCNHRENGEPKVDPEIPVVDVG